MANSYRYAYPELKALYFAVVDFDEAPQVFQSMNLNVAPVLIHFPAKGSRKRIDQMDFTRQGFDADSMARFVYDRAEIQVTVIILCATVFLCFSIVIISSLFSFPFLSSTNPIAFRVL